jgi:glycosidase
VGITQRWFAPEADREGWRNVSLPSAWESAAGAEGYDGWAWYTRMIVLADTLRPLSLHFAGVDDDAVVWVNGVRLADHAGYSEPFTVDLSGHLKPGENLLTVLVNDHGGPGGIVGPVTLVESAHLGRVLRGPYADRRARKSAPWVRDAVIYSVYLRSFSREGTFEGLRERIPALKEMGVTVVWLLPIHPIGVVKRKGTLGSPYSVQDYYGVNPEFGTLEEFRALVRSVHAEGMHLILDLVANHTAWDSRLLEEHPEWFSHDTSGAIVSPDPLYSDVADLDYTQRGLRQYMIEMMCWWVREIGIDGFRCDVAELVRPVMMLAEGTLPVYHLAAFDLTYAWNTYDMLEPLLRGERPARGVHSALRAEALQFPVGSLRMRFTTNHDKNYWDAPAVEKFGRDGLKLGINLMFALPGVPMIYTGEEVANNRRLSLFEKVEVDWARPRDTGALYRDLALLRERHPALRAGDYQVVPTDDDAVLAFLRVQGSDRIFVAFNFSRQRRMVTLNVPHLAHALLEEHGTGRSLRIGEAGTLRLSLEARASTFLVAVP